MNQYIRHIISGIALLVLQFMFQNNFILYDTAFCFVYVAIILFLPFETPRMLLIVSAFVLGICVDMFNDTLGINAASCVLIAFLRPTILGLMTPKSGYDQNFQFSIRDTGLVWIATYCASLIFIHHLVLFSLDASSFSLIWSVLLKTFFSTLLTLFVVLFGQLIFSRSTAKK